ncbi:hypothetical protein Leryth_021813 [Lithospermum erythrorhizon]|nr:hypothetical protein Leryth_021813 [Lithospermum erythrorhizon]
MLLFQDSFECYYLFIIRLILISSILTIEFCYHNRLISKFVIEFLILILVISLDYQICLLHMFNFSLLFRIFIIFSYYFEFVY